IELPDGATALERSGYGAGSLKVGDVVTVRAVAAPAERNRALASAVTAGRGGALLFKLSVTTHRTDGPVPRWPDGHVQLGPPPGSRGYWKADVAELDLLTSKPDSSQQCRGRRRCMRVGSLPNSATIPSN